MEETNISSYLYRLSYELITLNTPLLTTNMIKKEDKIRYMVLYNSHESDRVFMRPDGTTYVCKVRKNVPDTYYTPQMQLELPLEF